MDQSPESLRPEPAIEPHFRNCPTHGEFTSTLLPAYGDRVVWSGCPTCQDQREQERVDAAVHAEAERREAMMEEAAIPRRFVSRTFDNFLADTDGKKHALAMAQAYVVNFEQHLEQGSGLVFSGMPGTGKSHLAAAILKGIMPKYVGRYTTAMGVIRAIRATWRRDSERSESEVLYRIASLPLLVIDELGVQYGTEGEQTVLFDVLDRRYRDMAPTILLTNQDTKGLREFIGDRSFDRLREICRWVPFEWASHRPEMGRATIAQKGAQA